MNTNPNSTEHEIEDIPSSSRALVIWQPAPRPSAALRALPFIFVASAGLATYGALPFVVALGKARADVTELVRKPADVHEMPRIEESPRETFIPAQVAPPPMPAPVREAVIELPRPEISPPPVFIPAPIISAAPVTRNGPPAPTTIAPRVPIAGPKVMRPVPHPVVRNFAQPMRSFAPMIRNPFPMRAMSGLFNHRIFAFGRH